MRCSTGPCALLLVAALLAGACASAPPRDGPGPAPVLGPELEPDATDPAEAEVVVAQAPPELGEPAELTAAEGEEVSAQIQATDPNDDPFTFSATGLPPGLSLDPSGLLTGVAAAGSRGSYSPLVTVDDGFGTTESAITLTVTPTTVIEAPDPDEVRFAVIGAGGGEAAPAMAELIDGWGVDFVAAAGNLNPTGDALTIDLNVGRFYSRFIEPYTGAFGEGSTDRNRFFPALGEGEWSTITCELDQCAGPSLDYFTLPGNERYYDVVEGPVHLFVLDSDAAEPDGRDAASVQAEWLRTGLEASDALWKVVLVHAPGWSSATGAGSEEALRWPFAAWGADAVLAGRSPVYERLTIDGIPHIVNGTGGDEAGELGPEPEFSELRDDASVGVTRVLAAPSSITFQSVGLDGTVIDSFTRLPADRNPPPVFGRLPNRFGVSGQVIALPVTASDLDGDPLTYSVEDLPPGLTLDESSGLITGSIDAPEPSRWTVVVTATDGTGSASATFDWYVGFSSGSTITARPVDGSDDAEEAPDGSISIVSTDLELVRDEATDQIVGIRFPGVDVPAGAKVLDAYVELVADEVSSDPTSLTLRVEEADDAAPFSETAFDVSGRPLAPTAVGWTVTEPWDEIGESHRTPDLSALIQAIVSRPGWQPGNAVAFVVNGSGRRTAASVDFGGGREPELVVTYATDGGA